MVGGGGRRGEQEGRLPAVVRGGDRLAGGPDGAGGPGRDRSRAPPAARSSAHRVAICDPLPGGGVLELRKPRLRHFCQAANWSPIGRRRIRLPVAAEIALHSAGAKGGSPGSPTPLDGTSIPFSTMCTSVTDGDSSIRRTP